MVINNFNQLIKKVSNFEKTRKVAIVVAEDEHTLEAVFKANDERIVDPILIGNKERIKEILDRKNYCLDDEFIIDVENDRAAAYKAVELVNSNKADFIMKGKIQTADLLKAVVDKEKGIRTDRLMSHFAILEIP